MVSEASCGSPQSHAMRGAVATHTPMPPSARAMSHHATAVAWPGSSLRCWTSASAQPPVVSSDSATVVQMVARPMSPQASGPSSLARIQKIASPTDHWPHVSAAAQRIPVLTTGWRFIAARCGQKAAPRNGSVRLTGLRHAMVWLEILSIAELS